MTILEQILILLILSPLIYLGVRNMWLANKVSATIEGKPRYWLQMICHDCDAKVGELHQPGCDMERCSLCNPIEERQLITCGHYEEVMKGDIDRIPYVQSLVHCAVCNELYPDFFNVPDAEWDKYVIPTLQHQVLCRDCYDTMKGLFPNGWRNKDG